MTLFWRMTIALAVVTFVAAIMPTCVFACSCLPPAPPAETLAQATAVFSGRVTALALPADRGGPDPVQVTFAVSQGWKGADQATIVLRTPGSSASCGVDFVEGQEYLVYATESEGWLQTNLCSRTTQLAMAGEDLAVLGAGSAPAAGTETPTTLPSTGDELIGDRWRTSLAAGLMIALGAAILGYQRRTAKRFVHVR